MNEFFPLTFKSALVTLSSALIALFVFHVSFAISLVWLALPVCIFLICLIYGSANIQSGFFAPVLCCANVEDKQIALTFDDGPDPIFTPKVLKVLAEYQASASFFVIGKNIAGNENILKQMQEEGHVIANHSYTHSSWIDFKSADGFKVEFNKATDAIFAVLGIRPALFRPPFGVMTPHLVKAATCLNYNIIGWSVRSFDTAPGSVEAIMERIQTQLKPGGIVLLHDTSDKSVAVLKQILDFARQNDYKITGLEQLLNIQAYHAQ